MMNRHHGTSRFENGFNTLDDDDAGNLGGMPRPEELPTVREFENRLREAGHSRNEAKQHARWYNRMHKNYVARFERYTALKARLRERKYNAND